MIIVPNRQAVVIKAENAAQVLSCIPTAKEFTYKGQQLLYVPHRMDEVRVLRNLGAQVPSPILYYYDWPKKDGKYDPYAHQKTTSEFLTFYHRAAVLNAPRTGKSLSCLWTADYMMKQKAIRKVLIVCPLSTMELVWGDEIYNTFYWRKAVIVYGDRATRHKRLKQEADFYIVNHDGFQVIKDELPKDIDLIIYDEAAVLRNPSTNRFKFFNFALAERPKLRLWLLTGTPTPNEPTDAWTLCKLLGQDVPRYTMFREMVMMKLRMWTWVPRPGAEDTVSRYLQPSIRYTRDECFDLPDTTYESRKCEMSATQKKMVADMVRKFSAEVNGQQISAVHEASKVQKLLQILLGVAYATNGDTVFIGCAGRIEVIREVIEECDEKVIVCVPFTGALHEMAQALSKHYTCEVVDGGVGKASREKIFKAFQDTPRPRVLLVNARVMQHGLDLTAATTIIWAGPTNSNETFEQACDRIKGPKQKHKTSIVCIEATEIERKIYKRLKDKQTMQGLLLDIIQNQGELL